MKKHCPALVAATFGLAALLVSGCSNKERVAQAQPAPVAQATPAPAVRGDAAPAAAAAASWAAIKDLTYEQRAEFVAGIVALEGQLDIQINGLNAKRAAMTTGTKDWDFAMGEMTNARSYLQSMATEVGSATPDTWGQEKEKVNQAWLKAQDAYEKVRASTTN
ncbi:MAG TPA: hypothetical protein VN775_12705 [Opitutaceae bacterium]|nr:hypothetical protein [Opitutaceae bacterium]